MDPGLIVGLSAGLTVLILLILVVGCKFARKDSEDNHDIAKEKLLGTRPVRKKRSDTTMSSGKYKTEYPRNTRQNVSQKPEQRRSVSFNDRGRLDELNRFTISDQRNSEFPCNESIRKMSAEYIGSHDKERQRVPCEYSGEVNYMEKERGKRQYHSGNVKNLGHIKTDSRTIDRRTASVKENIHEYRTKCKDKTNETEVTRPLMRTSSVKQTVEEVKRNSKLNQESGKFITVNERQDIHRTPDTDLNYYTNNSSTRKTEKSRFNQAHVHSVENSRKVSIPKECHIFQKETETANQHITHRSPDSYTIRQEKYESRPKYEIGVVQSRDLNSGKGRPIVSLKPPMRTQTVSSTGFETSSFEESDSPLVQKDSFSEALSKWVHHSKSAKKIPLPPSSTIHIINGNSTMSRRSTKQTHFNLSSLQSKFTPSVEHHLEQSENFESQDEKWRSMPANAGSEIYEQNINVIDQTSSPPKQISPASSKSPLIKHFSPSPYQEPNSTERQYTKQIPSSNILLQTQAVPENQRSTMVNIIAHQPRVSNQPTETLQGDMLPQEPCQPSYVSMFSRQEPNNGSEPKKVSPPACRNTQSQAKILLKTKELSDFKPQELANQPPKPINDGQRKITSTLTTVVNSNNDRESTSIPEDNRAGELPTTVCANHTIKQQSTRDLVDNTIGESISVENKKESRETGPLKCRMEETSTAISTSLMKPVKSERHDKIHSQSFTDVSKYVETKSPNGFKHKPATPVVSTSSSVKEIAEELHHKEFSDSVISDGKNGKVKKSLDLIISESDFNPPQTSTPQQSKTDISGINTETNSNSGQPSTSTDGRTMDSGFTSLANVNSAEVSAPQQTTQEVFTNTAGERSNQCELHSILKKRRPVVSFSNKDLSRVYDDDSFWDDTILPESNSSDADDADTRPLAADDRCGTPTKSDQSDEVSGGLPDKIANVRDIRKDPEINALLNDIRSRRTSSSSPR